MVLLHASNPKNRSPKSGAAACSSLLQLLMPVPGQREQHLNTDPMLDKGASMCHALTSCFAVSATFAENCIQRKKEEEWGCSLKQNAVMSRNNSSSSQATPSHSSPLLREGGGDGVGVSIGILLMG